MDPATLESVKKIVQHDLAACDPEQVSMFQKYAIEPYHAPLLRYGEIGMVVVVARKGSEVIYWEDVEQGFNVSPLGADGQILDHCCNQDELCFALNAWIPGRSPASRCGPATPVE